MTEESTVLIQNYSLHRLTLRPEGETRAGMIFFHGQGDYVDRYPEYLTPFLDAGIEIILTDLPGHGRSPGRRGAVPGMAFVDELLEETLQHFSPSLPRGIAGHSMGGMLALRAYLREPERYDFAWFSSPLLNPSHQVSSIFETILMALAKLFPWLTRSTGVKATDCRTDSPNEEQKEKLYHASITLGWARELIATGHSLRDGFLSFPQKNPVLFTQGELDPICPPTFLRERLAKLSDLTALTYEEIPLALHEPFTGENTIEFQKKISNWIHRISLTDTSLLAPRIARAKNELHR